MNRSRLIVLLTFLTFTGIAAAQTSPQPNAAEIKLALKKLNVVGSVLYIAAHPDDENTRLLAYLSKDRLYRTGYLSLTRGDGGQNLIGSEQGELLGLIRTQELLVARKTDGAEQFFSRALDFGFSKTADETFRMWNKQQILADVVWIIRKFRPDIIITRFPGDSRAGHGNHEASSLLAQEGFKAAADPAQFPEQLAYVKPWQAKRILWNSGSFFGDLPNQMKLDVGAFNALLGKGYGEIAAESRSKHSSQGMGTASQRGQSSETFTFLNGEKPVNDLMDGIETSWKRVAGAGKVAALADKIDRDFVVDKPYLSVPPLVELLTEIEKVKDDYWKEQKKEEIRSLIASCAGLWFESYSSEPVVALGNMNVSSKLIVTSPVPVKLLTTSTARGGAINNVNHNIAMAPGVQITVDNLITNITSADITQPYWLESKHPVGSFVVKEQQSIGNPQNPNPPAVFFNFEIAGKTIAYSRPVVYKYTDQTRGEIYQPVSLAPPVTAAIENKVMLFTGAQSKSVQIKLASAKENASGNVLLKLPAGWTSVPEKISFSLKKGDEQTVSFQVTPSAKSNSGTLSALVESEGGTFSKEIKTIKYDHIPAITIFPEAEAKLVKLDLKTTGKKIGYITGAGDLVPDMLREIGYQVNILTEDELNSGNLSAYDAVVAGVRAYNINPRLKFQQAQLLKYVENGGTLLIQYNVNRPLVMNQIGPYPFTISNTRVAEEDAPVEILKPEHPVFNFPNKITRADFDGWIQERGIYFATAIDPKYPALLSMHDTGEADNTGSLLVADYGKGKFVYTSLVFFRELPAGIPGAYRLFVNLISKNK